MKHYLNRNNPDNGEFDGKTGSVDKLKKDKIIAYVLIVASICCIIAGIICFFIGFSSLLSFDLNFGFNSNFLLPFSGMFLVFIGIILLTFGQSKYRKFKSGGRMNSVPSPSSVRRVHNDYSPSSAPSVICPQCGMQNDGKAAFCTECGASLTKKCPKCGEENPCDAKFCANCGKNFNSKSN